MFGQQWMARLVSRARPLTADQFWQLTNQRKLFVQAFTNQFRAQGFDAVLCPPHGLPAMQHVKGFDLIAAASYSFLFNLLGWPAGTVSLTRVRTGEEGSRPDCRDQVSRQAQAVDRKSAGLPVGVQVAALPWREDVVLALMSALEADFRDTIDYPGKAIVPAIEANAATT
jgi:fatty acid amide hydrolase